MRSPVKVARVESGTGVSRLLLVRPGLPRNPDYPGYFFKLAGRRFWCGPYPTLDAAEKEGKDDAKHL